MKVLAALATPLVLGWLLWAAAALWIDGPASKPLAGALAALPLLAAAWAVARVRPWPRAIAVIAIAPALVTVWWSSLEASNDRDWLRDVAHPPEARLEGDILTISNVRNFEYRADEDYEEHWETRSYDLSKLEGVDMFFSHWGSPHIAHTIASWAFSDGQHLAISIETRKEQGEAYSAILGFFRQFELYYVVGDERDLVGVRAAHRGEDVYLYRLTTPVPVARAVLLDYVESINQLAAEAAWYNALTFNCTTAIRRHIQNVAANDPFDWRILVNGYLPELGYERGRLDDTLPFEELKARSDITEAAKAAVKQGDFAARIRQGLPGRSTSVPQ
jgi:hypothetical protein